MTDDSEESLKDFLKNEFSKSNSGNFYFYGYLITLGTFMWPFAVIFLIILGIVTLLNSLLWLIIALPVTGLVVLFNKIRRS